MQANLNAYWSNFFLIEANNIYVIGFEILRNIEESRAIFFFSVSSNVVSFLKA